MTFEELQDLLAEQFSCDTGDLSRGTARLTWAPTMRI